MQIDPIIITSSSQTGLNGQSVLYKMAWEKKELEAKNKKNDMMCILYNGATW